MTSPTKSMCNSDDEMFHSAFFCCCRCFVAKQIYFVFSLLFRHIQEFSAWLKGKLDGIHHQYDGAKASGPGPGRLGPPKVVFVADDNDGNNLVKISKDKLTIVSQSAFCTLKANCCVYKGKWMYEVCYRFIDFFSSVEMISNRPSHLRLTYQFNSLNRRGFGREF